MMIAMQFEMTNDNRQPKRKHPKMYHLHTEPRVLTTLDIKRQKNHLAKKFASHMPDVCTKLRRLCIAT